MNSTAMYIIYLVYIGTSYIYQYIIYIPIDIESELCFWDADKSVMLSAFTRERIRFGMICGQHKELIDWSCIGQTFENDCWMLDAGYWMLDMFVLSEAIKAKLTQ